jgi:hypothetical protein
VKPRREVDLDRAKLGTANEGALALFRCSQRVLWPRR